MGKKLPLSAEKRAQIVSLSTINLLEREISREVKVSKTAVHTAIKKFKTKVLLRTAKDQVIQGFAAAEMSVLSGR